MKLVFKYFLLMITGGIVYCLIELLWRGYSHWTMFILGGICFISLGLINEVCCHEAPLLMQMLIGCTIITSLEFITGCIVNIHLGWNVWDYSSFRFNIHGQIALHSSVAWYFLSAVGIVLDDWLRKALFNEDIPRYKLL